MREILVLYTIGVLFMFAVLVFPPTLDGQARQAQWWPEFSGRRLRMWCLIGVASVFWPCTWAWSLCAAASDAEWHE